MLGLDVLGFGHPKFPKKMIIKHFPKKDWAFGTFDDSVFGKQQKEIRQLLDTGKVPVVRAHLNWDAKHGLISMENLKRRLPKWYKLACEYPGIWFYLSHSCEHSSRNKAEVEKRMLYVTENAPGCAPVNSILPGAYVVPGKTNEFHDPFDVPTPEPFIVSLDGKMPSEIPLRRYIQEYRNTASITFLWIPEFNLRREGQAFRLSKPIKQRTNTLTEAQLKALIKGRFVK